MSVSHETLLLWGCVPRDETAVHTSLIHSGRARTAHHKLRQKQEPPFAHLFRQNDSSSSGQFIYCVPTLLLGRAYRLPHAPLSAEIEMRNSVVYTFARFLKERGRRVGSRRSRRSPWCWCYWCKTTGRRGRWCDGRCGRCWSRTSRTDVALAVAVVVAGRRSIVIRCARAAVWWCIIRLHVIQHIHNTTRTH